MTASEEPAGEPVFVLPESTRAALRAVTAQATAQLVQSEAVLRVASEAAAAAQAQLQPMLASIVEQLEPLQREIAAVLQAASAGRSTTTGSASATVGLQASASGRSTVSGSATVLAETVDTAAAFDSVTVVVSPAASSVTVGGDGSGSSLGEDLYRLLGVISLQLDDLLERRSASPVELYNAVVQTLTLLATLLAVLAQQGVIKP